MFGSLLRLSQYERPNPRHDRVGLTRHKETKPRPQAAGIDGEELVFEGRQQLITPGVTLASTTAEELSVNTTRLVPLRGHNMQPPTLYYPWGQANVRPP